MLKGVVEEVEVEVDDHNNKTVILTTKSIGRVKPVTTATSEDIRQHTAQRRNGRRMTMRDRGSADPAEIVEAASQARRSSTSSKRRWKRR